MPYIVDELTDNLNRYEKIAESNDYTSAVREEAKIIAAHAALLLLRIADNSITLEDETGEEWG